MTPVMGMCLSLEGRLSCGLLAQWTFFTTVQREDWRRQVRLWLRLLSWPAGGTCSQCPHAGEGKRERESTQCLSSLGRLSHCDTPPSNLRTVTEGGGNRHLDH
jgi:hypothetical protein